MADMPTCSNCGAAIQYDDGKLTQMHFSSEGIGEDLRCEKCAGPVLAEALVLGQSMTGEYHYGPNVLTWECGRDPDDPERIMGGIGRAFLSLLARAIDAVSGGKRKAGERALRRLVGEGGPHEDTCECLCVAGTDTLAEVCPYCHARIALAIQSGGA